MNNSILMSFSALRCEHIANNKLKVEVRKNKPTLQPPFKVYIYCQEIPCGQTLHTYINSGYGREHFGTVDNWRSGEEVVDVNCHLPAYRYNSYLAEGKVIGEFTCTGLVYIEAEYDIFGNKQLHNTAFIQNKICLTENELFDYLYNGEDNKGWGWLMSNITIYDKPKELKEFGIDVPPQYWCYL